MASINLSGVLRDSLGAFSHLNKIRFTHNSTTGTTLAGFQQTITIPEDGSYDIDIEYGNVFIESKDATANNWFIHGTVTINSDTVATDLPTLLNAVTPVTDEQLLQLQTLLEEASTARDEAEASATAAAESATETETAVTAFYNSNPANIDWDLFVSFNSDGKLDRGVGTKDTYGNDIIDFTRASAASVLNKSGVLQDLGANEVAVTKNGAWFHEDYTNSLTYSEDFSASTWQGSATRTADYIVENGFHFNNVVTTENNVDTPNYTTSLSVVDGATMYISMVVNVNESSATGLRVMARSFIGSDFDGAYIDFTTDTNGANSDLIYLGRTQVYNGVYEYRFSIEASSPNVSYVNISPYTSIGSVDVGENLVVTNVMVTTVKNAPYIKTEATAVSVARTYCTVPMSQNMPAAGLPFSIVVDAAIPNDGETSRRIFFNSYTNNVHIARITTGTVIFAWSTSEGTYSIGAGTTSEDVVRYTYVYDGSIVYAYVDGELINQSTSGQVLTYNAGSDELSIGGFDGIMLNGTIENFGIIGRALTADEVKARGAAQ